MSQKSNIHFDISERKILLRIIDILAVLAVLYAVGLIFQFDYFRIDATRWLWSIVLALYLTIFATVFELYDLQKAAKFEIVVQNVILASSVTVLFYLLTPFYTPELPDNRMQIIYFFVSINIALFVWRYAYIVLISAPRFFKKVLLITDSASVVPILEALQKSDPNYKIVGFIDFDQKTNSLNVPDDLQRYDSNDISKTVTDHQISEIVVATPAAAAMTISLNNQLVSLLEKGVPIREYTQVYEEITHRIPVQHVERDFYRYFPFSRSNQNKLYMLYHRLMDLICSILGIVIGILLLPLVLVGNLIGNKGKLLYVQTRVGKNGKPFKIYKFRTMVKNAEKDGVKWADKNDSRITTFGRFLRRSRLDEIPQFINVLKGDMSIIGPRPERPYFVKELSRVIPFYETRHTIKPGLSGWAQVNSRYGSSIEDSLVKLQYDLYYIKHRSFFLDINIIVKTLSTMVYYRGQ